MPYIKIPNAKSAGTPDAGDNTNRIIRSHYYEN